MRDLFQSIRANEIAFFYGVICIAGLFTCLLLSRYYPIQVLGINAWVKPAKFFLSVAIFTWSMGVFTQYLDNQKQVLYYSWSMVICFSLELIPIVYQAARGKLSHFNQETGFDRMIFNLMALIITLLMLHTLYIFFLFISQKQFEIPANLVLGIKLGMLLTVVFAFEGFAMGAILKHTVGANDGTIGLPVVNWSKNHGDLRVSHFFGIHALQIIPLVSYLFTKSKREVVIISAIYFAFVTYTLVQALQGRPFLKL